MADGWRKVGQKARTYMSPVAFHYTAVLIHDLSTVATPMPELHSVVDYGG